MTLNKLLVGLSNDGCFPSIYLRGDCWRAHVNVAGNFWHDDSTPLRALEGAVKLWRASGKPRPGLAREAAEAAKETT